MDAPDFDKGLKLGTGFTAQCLSTSGVLESLQFMYKVYMTEFLMWILRGLALS